MLVDFDDSLLSVDSLIAEAVAAADPGVEVVVGKGKGFYLPPADFPKDADVAWLSRDGKDADIEPEVTAGKVVIFDFWAEWCGPCRELDRGLIERVGKDPSLAVRKLNVVDWDSEVAKRYLTKVSGLPYVEVWHLHEKKGPRRVGFVSGLDFEKLDRLIEKARR